MIRIEHNPTRWQLAVFGLAWLLCFGLLGGLSWWKTGSFGMPSVFWAIGVVVPAIGLVWPGVLRFVFLAASYATFPIGFVVSYLILAFVYFIVIAPIGLALRLMGRDPMQRRFDRVAKTYWTPREQEESAKRYFQQF